MASSSSIDVIDCPLLIVNPAPTSNAPSTFSASSILTADESDELIEFVTNAVDVTDVSPVSDVSSVIVIVLLEPLVVIFAPPETCKVSLSRSMFSAVESSVAKSKSCAVTWESTYVLIAFAEAKVSSDPETLVRSVSRTPDFRSATSMLDIELPVPSTSNVLFVNVSVVALPTNVSVAAGNVTVTSAVLAGPSSVTPFVPLSVPSKNFIEPPALLLPAPITRLCPVAVVVVAATVVNLSVPSTSIVTFPVPESTTVTLLSPVDIDVVLTADTSLSTYAFIDC